MQELINYSVPGMNNKETIEQVERGYRMANPVHIVYPESKTCPKELAQAQSNVYKVCSSKKKLIECEFHIFARLCWNVGSKIHSKGLHLSSWLTCLRTSA